MNSKEISTDVLLIGGGPAAFLAAIKAREAGAQRVTIVCKAVAGSSGAGMYMMGNIRDWRPEECEEVFPILVRQSQFMVDQDWLEYTIKENHKRMEELRRWGVKFLKVRGKEVRTGMGTFVGGERNPNVWVDGGALELLWTLRGQALKAGAHILDRMMVSDLLTSDGKHPSGAEVVGAIGLDVRSGDFCVFRAKATVVTTGGAIIPRRLPPDLTSDGHGMAIRAGARMRMDTFEFLGGGTLGNATSGTSHVFSSFGTRLVNVFRPEQAEEKDYSPRPALRGTDFNIQKAQEDVVRLEKKDIPSAESYGGPCWDFGWRADFRECSPKDLQMISRTNPRIMKIFEKLGIEVPEDMVPLIRVPLQVEGTNGSGGIGINRDHECSLPGLFAAGTVADKVGYRNGGLNGAFVGGAIAGSSAATYAGKKSEPSLIREQVEKLREVVYAPMGVKDGFRPLELRQKIVEAACQAILDKGFVVTEESLKRAIDAIGKLKTEVLPLVVAKDFHQLMKVKELKNMLDVIPLQFKAAILRKESRMLPREDYPYRDDRNWLKFINSRLKEDGEIEFWTEDIPSMKIKPQGVE